MRILSFIAFCMIGLVGYSQTLTEQLLKINSAYNNNDYSVEFDVKIQATQQSPLESYGSGLIQKQGDDFHTKMEQSEFIYNKDGVIYIDHLRSKVSYQKGEAYQAPKPLTDEQIKQMLKNSDTAYWVKHNEQEFLCRFVQKNQEIELIDVVVDSKTFFIKQMIYTYREDPFEEYESLYQMKINYSSQELETKKGQFRTKSFLKKKGKKWSYIPDEKYVVELVNKQ